jgi:hypothetical protein
MWGSELTTKAATLQGGPSEFVPSFVYAGLGPALFWFTRYLIVVPRQLLPAALVVLRRYLFVVPRPMPAAPCT